MKWEKWSGNTWFGYDDEKGTECTIAKRIGSYGRIPTWYCAVDTKMNSKQFKTLAEAKAWGSSTR